MTEDGQQHRLIVKQVRCGSSSSAGRCTSSRLQQVLYEHTSDVHQGSVSATDTCTSRSSAVGWPFFRVPAVQIGRVVPDDSPTSSKPGLVCAAAATGSFCISISVPLTVSVTANVCPPWCRWTPLRSVECPMSASSSPTQLKLLSTATTVAVC